MGGNSSDGVNKIAVVLFIGVLLTGAVIGSNTVLGQSSTSEIKVSPSEVSLAADESRTIEINYANFAGSNPEGIEFVVEYNASVISVTDVSKGGYISGGVGSINPSPGRVGFGWAQEDPVTENSGTVATITIELADGVNKGDTTDITFTSVSTPGTDSSPETIDGTVEAAEGTDSVPQNDTDYNVRIIDPTLSESRVDESASDHTLNFEVTNISADGSPDDVSVTLPDTVNVEDITETSVTNRETGASVAIAGDDPADNPDPGNEITFSVNPESDVERQALNVEIKMQLSAAS